MTDLKRTICGVAIHADTTDPVKVKKIKAALDRAMKLLRDRKDGKDLFGFLDGLRGMKGPVR